MAKQGGFKNRNARIDIGNYRASICGMGTGSVSLLCVIECNVHRRLHTRGTKCGTESLLHLDFV